MKDKKILLVLIGIAIGWMVLMNLFIGSVHIPPGEVCDILFGKSQTSHPWNYIIWEIRLPQALTALLAGAGLSVSGLLLQTAFHNPLAGPSVLGITSGANLGVALVILLMGGVLSAGSVSLGGYAAIILAAFIGSLLIIGLLITLSTLLKDNLMLLITGILISYLTSSIITLLNTLSTAEGVQNYVVWGMGSFNSVSYAQLPFFGVTCLVGLTLALLLIKPLNALQLGEHYAANLGINLTSLRTLLLLATGLLTAVITAFCGPVSFLGLAVPHVARLILRTDNHRLLMPGTLLLGSLLALICNLLCVLPDNRIIPLNAVTPLLGAPVILYVILKRRR